MYVQNRRVMKQILCLLPFLATSLITKYDPIQINSASLIYQKYYMFDKLSAPVSKSPYCVVLKCSSIGNGQSYLEMSFNITKTVPDVYSRGIVEVCTTLPLISQAFFATNDFFEKIGYLDDQKKIACCDENGLVRLLSSLCFRINTVRI